MKLLDQAILNYLNGGSSIELDSLIESPLDILNSHLIPERHKIKVEALAIMDFLNSINTGLEDYTSHEKLLDISNHSPLYSFRCGVLAINEFYKGNNNKVTEYLNEVNISSPAYKLSKYILKDKDTALFSINEELSSSINELKEVINNSMVDLYPKTVELVLNDLENVEYDELLNSILTIIEDSIDAIPLEIIHQSIIPFVPVSESTRLMALGTMYRYPIKSLGYLFSYANLAEFDDSDDENFKALLLIIKDIVKTLIRQKYKFSSVQEKHLFIQESNIFIHILNDFYNLDYKESENPLTNLRRALDIKIEETELVPQKEFANVVQGELF